jgi:hypothetical protein
MSSEEGTRLSTRHLAAYLQGEVTASEAGSIETELRDNAGTRKRLAELQHIRDVLSAPVPELAQLDLVARVQTALAQPSRASSTRGRVLMRSLAAAAALVAVAVMLRDVSQHGSSASEFRAKSSGSAVAASRRWAGIQVHRIDAAGKSERADEQLTAQDDLVFSYANLGPAPFDYLMIFAVDASGKVYWFYPAYERQDTDPPAVAIQKSASEAPLPDLIHHDFAYGPLSIYGLFARHPLRVSQVEAWLGEHGGRITSVTPLPETSLHSVTLRVEP